MEVSNGRPATQDPDRTPLPTPRPPTRQVYAAFRRDWLISVRRTDSVAPGTRELFTGYAYEVEEATGRLLRPMWVSPRATSVETALEIIHGLVDQHDRVRAGALGCGPRLWARSVKCCPDCTHRPDELTKCTYCGLVGGAL